MNRERLIWIGVILLILAIAVWIGRRDGRKLEQMRNQAELLQREVDGLTASRDTALSRAKVESEQRVKIVLQADAEQTTLKAEIKRLKRKRTVLSPPVVSVDPGLVIIDSTGILANCDSLTERQSELIYSLEGEKEATTASFNRQLAQMDSALKSQAQVAEVWRAGNQESNKKLKRQRFWTKFWRSVGIGAVAAGGVIAVTSQ